MTSLTYRTTIEGLTSDQLTGGFFAGWPNPPSAATHLRILESADHKVVAVRGARVVGFATALSDGIMSAYIPLVEVLPKERKQGIGTQLIQRLIHEIGHVQRVDLLCDPDLAGFYRDIGFTSSVGMYRRDYAMQSGRP